MDNIKQFELIKQYIQTNFGNYSTKTYMDNTNFECTSFHTSQFDIIVCFEYAFVEISFWNTKPNLENAKSFQKWYVANIIKNSSYQTTNKTFPCDNIQLIKMEYGTPNNDVLTIGKIINALNANNDYTLTNGNINLYGKNQYKTLIAKNNKFKILITDTHHIKIWEINATSFDNAYQIAKPIITQIMEIINCKTFDYEFVNCMFAYNMEISFK